MKCAILGCNKQASGRIKAFGPSGEEIGWIFYCKEHLKDFVDDRSYLLSEKQKSKSTRRTKQKSKKKKLKKRK